MGIAEKLVLWILITVGCTMVPLSVFADGAAGDWDTNWGQMKIHQNDIQISGNYSDDNGELVGEIHGNVIQGYWIEDQSDQRCSRPINGRYHWGRVEVVFDPSFTSFGTRWGYCDGSLDRNDWSGRRTAVASSRSIAGRWQTSWGEMTLSQSVASVSGTYASDNGQITGDLNGNVLEGYWIEDSSGQQCSTPLEGRHYWGRVRMIFDPTSASFKTEWGYCNGTLENSDWNGTLIASASAEVAAQQAQSWPEPPKFVDWPSQTPPPPPVARVVFRNWNKASCSLTGTATFNLQNIETVNKLITWYNWRPDETSVEYRLYMNNQIIHQNILNKGSCDSFQPSWCQGVDAVDLALQPGNYMVMVRMARVCQNTTSNGTGFLEIQAAPLEETEGWAEEIPSSEWGIEKPFDAVANTDATGSWATGWGEMSLNQSGTHIAGRYSEDDGYIEGDIKGNVWHAYWNEDQEGNCTTRVNGRNHWGQVQVTFDASSSSFSGRWGYCDGPLDKGDLNGSRN